jgi:chaperonin GroEL (HSP60 family)
VFADGGGNAGDQGRADVATVERGPAKVVRSAFKNAASIASLLLTTEAVITQIQEQNSDAAMSGGGMGAGMYGEVQS